MRQSPPAYSLIFAFLVMTVIMIIASTTIENTNEKLVYFREMEGSTRALLAAQSSTELAVLAMKDANAGYSIDLTEDVFEDDLDGDGVTDTWGDYTVYSSAMENPEDVYGYYYTPIPGTGTAGSSDDCSILNTIAGNYEDPDHPCNWNKLLYGQSVTIPLFTDDGSGTGILTPADFTSFTGWYLKVRTPCSDTEGEPDEYPCSTRFEFDGDGADSRSSSADDDTTVVFWQIIGEDMDGNSVSLIPSVETYSSGFSDLKCRSYSGDCPVVDTDIYEYLIETASNNIVLAGANTVPYVELYEVCTGTHSNYSDGTWNGLSTLSLQLDIVQPLIDEDGYSIPYLEWQLASEASQGFADTKAVILGQGYHQGVNGIFYSPYVVTRSTTDESANVYTLSN